MAVTINAQATTGLLTTADGSGIVKLQSDGKTTNTIAWLNYNATVPSITSSYFISSVTLVSTGVFNINFSSNQSDANYALSGSVGTSTGTNIFCLSGSGSSAPTLKTAASVQVTTLSGATLFNPYVLSAMFFGN